MAKPVIILGTGLLNTCIQINGINIPYFKHTDISKLKYIYILKFINIYIPYFTYINTFKVKYTFILPFV
jgi:hypothetical protein